MSNRNKIIQIRFTEKELAMVEAICEKFGNISKSDAIRRCIQDRFIKIFPVYIKNVGGAGVPDEELTPEQICEQLGGKVGRREGNQVCILPHGVGENIVPLSMMGQKGMVGDYRVGHYKKV